MSTSPEPSQPADPRPGDASAAGEPFAGPQYYRPGPSSGYYPQYPQNPYGPGSPAGPPPQYRGAAPSYSAPPEQPTAPGGATYPYGGPYPGRSSTGPIGHRTAVPTRPGSVMTAQILLLLLSAFFVYVGLSTAIGPGPEAVVNDPQFRQVMSGTPLSVADVLSVVRVIGVVIAVAAVVYAALTVATFLGRFGALITLTVLTGLFDLFWLFALLVGAVNPAAAILPLLVLVLSLTGIALLFGAPARAWFAARK